MLDLIKGLGPSIIRTVSPWLVGLIVTGLARVGIDWTPSPEALVFATGVVAAVWYAVVRWLEERKDSRWGWLLGLPGAPSYPEPAQAINVPADGNEYEVDLDAGTATRVETIPGTTLPADPLEAPLDDYGPPR